MKIKSLGAVKTSEVPEPVRNTEAQQLTSRIEEGLKKLSAGQSLAVTVEGAKKWQRYALQHRLNKAGLKVKVRQDGNTFYVVRDSNVKA